MSSNDSVARWERQWGHLIARIRPNAAATRSRLLLAETNVQRAKRAVAADPDAALIFAEQVLINAADALLARDGYSANSHVVRFGYPQLPSVYSKEPYMAKRPMKIGSVRSRRQSGCRSQGEQPHHDGHRLQREQNSLSPTHAKAAIGLSCAG